MPDFRQAVKLNQIPVIGLVPYSSATPPSSPVDGQFWYNTTTKALMVYNATTTAWAPCEIVPGAGLTLTGNSLALTVPVSVANGGTNATSAGAALTSLGAAAAADLTTETSRAEAAEAANATAVTTETSRAEAAEALKAPIASPTFTGNVTLAANPSSSLQAATKQYVDAVAQGLSVKPSVDEATAAALPSNTYASTPMTLTATANGALTVDGIAVALGDRVLVQNEASAANNGIYTVTTLGTGSVPYVLTRSADMNSSGQIQGAFTFVEQGTANGNAGFVVAGIGPFTIGTTSITWTQFSGAGSVTAGTGLTKTGNVLSITAPVTVALGGTGATAAAAAIANLGGLPTAGGTMSGPIAMGGNKATGMANGSAAQDAATFVQLPSSSNPVPVGSGGTGSTSAVAARTALAAPGLYESAAIGDGSTLVYTITHNLNNAVPMVMVYDVSGANPVAVEADITATSVNALTVSFAVAATTGQYKVVVVG